VTRRKEYDSSYDDSRYCDSGCTTAITALDSHLFRAHRVSRLETATQCDRRTPHVANDYRCLDPERYRASSTLNTNYGPLWLQPSLLQDGRMVQFSGNLTF
jgi:hypothetical protein